MAPVQKCYLAFDLIVKTIRAEYVKLGTAVTKVCLSVCLSVCIVCSMKHCLQFCSYALHRGTFQLYPPNVTLHVGCSSQK